MWDIVVETAREGLTKGSDRGMNRLARIAALSALGVGFALGTVACSATTDEDYVVAEYEDCDVEDQRNREDDCGYWFYNGAYFLGTRPGSTAVWTYWSWVSPGKHSYAPVGWTAPHGLKAPAASDATKKRYKDHQKSLPKNERPKDSTKNGNTQPKTNSGNQGVPKNNQAPAPKAPAPRSGRR